MKEKEDFNFEKFILERNSKFAPVTGNKFRIEYRLNEVTNNLEEVGKVDIQEEIDSCQDSTLNKMLERFLPEESEEIVALDSVQSDLDYICKVKDIENFYKEKFDLPFDTDTREVFSKINEYKARLETQLKEKENIKNEEKTNKESE